MTNKTFDLNKCERNADGHYLCRTRSGLDAKVVYVMKGKRHPLMVVVINESGIEDLHHIKISGKYMIHGGEHPLDLVNIPRTIKVELWVNVYLDGDSYTHATKEMADAHARGKNRIACKHIVFEVFEGEGL